MVDKEIDVLKKFFLASGQGFGLAALDGEILYVNEALVKMCGEESEEACLGKSFTDYYTEKLNKGLREEIIPTVIEKGQWSGKLELLRPDGMSVPTLENYFLVRDENGAPLYIAAAILDITKEKIAEDDVRKLSRAVKQSPVSIVIADTKGAIEYVNPKFENVSGYSFAEVVGKNPRILKSGETSPEEYKKLWQTISSGGEWRGVFHNKRKNGELFWEAASISPVRDEKGEITHYIAVKEDITELKRLDDLLSESDIRYRSLFMNMLDGWAYHKVIYDEQDEPLDYVFLDVNNAFEKLTGLKKEELINKKVTDIFPDIHSHSPDLIEVYGNVASTREPANLTIYFQPLDSWFHISAYSPKPGYFVAIFENITEQKNADIALRKSENHLRAIVENEPECVKVLSSDGTLLDMNPAGLQMIEADYREVMGKSVLPLVVPEYRDAFNSLINSVCEGNKGSLEFQIIGLKGTPKWLESHAAPLRNEDGSYSFLSITRDITERKHAEDKLRKYARIISVTKEHMSFLDSNYLYQAVNDAYLEAHNKKREEIVGHSVAELFGQAVFDRQIKEKLDRAFAGEVVQFQDWFEFPATGRRFMEIFYYPYYDENKTIRGVVVSSRDVTEHKRTRDALESERDKAQHYLDIAGVAFVGIGTDRKVFLVNKKACELLGYVEEEIVGKNWFDNFLPERSREPVGEVFESLLQESMASVEYYENPVLTKSGKEKFMSWHNTVLRDEKGKIVSTLSFGEDITERKQTEEKVRLSAAVVESTAEGVIVTDVDNKIVAVNNAFTDITGYTEDEVLGSRPNILKSEKHDQTFYTTMWASLERAGLWQGEIWNRRKDGEIFPAWSTITAVHDQEGNVSNYVSVFSDITSIKHSQEQLDFLAHHDPLTNLPNRLLFNDRLDHAIQRAHREEKQLAVLFLDLDRFKNINDSLGHPIGDILLMKAGERIRKLLREEDTVARLGGDEFIIVVEEIKETQDVAVLAGKLMEAFSQSFQVKGHELHITVSMGISLYPRNGEDGATLVKNADTAMYRAKEEGRNDYQFYTTALTTAVFERLTLETALRQALEHNQLVLHYQPQYKLETGQVVGAEALVRWQHPDMGLVSPAKFIPLAEETGLILPLGEWVLHTASMQMQAWLAAGLDFGRIAINISGVQFQRADIVETIKRVIEQTGISPEHLELEITESFIMQRTKWAISVLDKLKDLGVSMAIDDFGTGYSSLSYLKRMPINKLKIDRSFVRDIIEDPNDEAITRAVLALGQSLQLEVVAEGIETREQAVLLKSLHCDNGQGFLYSKPLPAEEFSNLMKNAH